jgi:dihydrofolate reductase
MKLTTITHVSLDGVMQGLGGQDEDRSGGFERGGWAIPLFDDEAEASLVEAIGRADAFLFGRKTYDIFAGSWGTGSWGANQGNNPISVAFNTKPKYVASSTLTEPEWAGTTVLSGDVAAAIAELKAKPGSELQVHGSGALVRGLLENDLVDEINLFTYPVVVGQGTRLFPDTGPDRAFELIERKPRRAGWPSRPTGWPGARSTHRAALKAADGIRTHDLLRLAYAIAPAVRRS